MSKIITAPSAKGVARIALEEGFVGRAYLCPAGVLTIGHGLTNRSKTATAALGRIKRGDTITKQRSAQVLSLVLERESGPPVVRDCAPRKPHEFDAAVSMVYNCGPGATKWRWAASLKARAIGRAASLLRVTATTGGGRRLSGLVARRRREAAMLEKGVYAATGGFPSFAPARKAQRVEPDETLKEYQDKLRSLGLYKGPVDGLRGPLTTEAVLAIQKAHPNLVDNGVLGRATMAQIDRELDLRKKGGGTALGGGAGSAGAEGASRMLDFDLAGVVFGVGIAVTLVVLAWLSWSYRDEIKAMIARVRAGADLTAARAPSGPPARGLPIETAAEQGPAEETSPADTIIATLDANEAAKPRPRPKKARSKPKPKAKRNAAAAKGKAA